jgi:Xaa-Pro dipeptidase
VAVCALRVLTFRTAIEGLLKLGILQGDKEDILKTRTSVAFFPHGLGHYLGMDTVSSVSTSIFPFNLSW